ncbi:hypothetical protein KAR91_45900 [Candidatus Pacearchaeota archaeon]|nr:hypothetical protein [Candidatus Pacearchaeota archaeon]
MSRRNLFQNQRRARKLQLLAFIKKHPELNLKKLKGLFSIQTGATYKKIEEYLQELVDAELIALGLEKVEAIE